MNSSVTVEPARDAHRRSGSPADRPPLLTRRSFLGLSAASLGALALYSGEVARHEISIEERTIRLSRLPDAFRGMRIVQISDFHYKDFSEPSFIRDVVRHVNRLQPDMVLMTGDFVTVFHGWRRLARLTRMVRRQAVDCAAVLRAVECPLRYASLGNHDATLGSAYVAGVLEEHGIPVLLNRAIPLERGNQRIWLAGLGSACERQADPDQAIPPAGLRGNDPVILMAHEPDILPRIARYNVDLMLSGHTHGGQIRLPFLPPLDLPTLGKHYVEGLFRYGGAQLYVNRGIGTVGVPFRLWCPPEITVLTLA